MDVLASHSSLACLVASNARFLQGVTTLSHSRQPDGGDRKNPWVTVETVGPDTDGSFDGGAAALPAGRAGEECDGVMVASELPERLLRASASRAPIMLFALDPAGRIVLACGEGHAALGLDPRSLIGLRSQDVFCDEPEVLAALSRALQGEDFCLELKCRNLVLECRYTAVRSESGEVLSVIGTALDVTARARTKAALRDTEMRLRTVISSAPVVLYAMNAEGIITLAEGKALESFGVLPHELAGRSVFDLCKNEPSLFDAVQRAVAGQEFSEVVQLQGAAFHCHNSPLFSAAGDRIGAIGVAVDVTAQTQMTKALLRSEAKYRGIIESVNDGIWRVDQNWKTTFVNRRMAEMLGRRAEDVLGRSLFEFIAAQPDAFRLQPMLQLQCPLAEAVELRVRLKCGKELLALAAAAPIYNESGQYSGALLTVIDVTKRRRLENELQRRDAELAHTARLRTMGEFMAGITHEIHQPLHAIATFASACQKALESDAPPVLADLTHWTQQISKQTRRVEAIIQRLGKFFRRNAPLATAPIDLNDLIHETLEMLASEVRRQKIRLHLGLSDQVPHIEGDEVQIAQLIINLMRNAIDAMAEIPPARRQLRIRTAVTAQSWVEVSVEDSGLGFAEECAEQIFEPFYTTKPNGMGMGLAICRSIAEAHRGRLLASSSAGQGATFCLQLPWRKQSDVHGDSSHGIYCG